VASARGTNFETPELAAGIWGFVCARLIDALFGDRQPVFPRGGRAEADRRKRLALVFWPGDARGQRRKRSEAARRLGGGGFGGAEAEAVMVAIWGLRGSSGGEALQETGSGDEGNGFEMLSTETKLTTAQQVEGIRGGKPRMPSFCLGRLAR